MANIITAFRIVCSAVLLFSPAYSPVFYLLYLSAGLSDILDGLVARRTHSESASGARLDTIADFAFALAASIKILPLVTLPRCLWWWVALIAVMKLINLAHGLIRHRALPIQHTVLNKLTGLSLFLLPLTLSFLDVRYSAAAICLLATAAAWQEGRNIRAGTSVM